MTMYPNHSLSIPLTHYCFLPSVHTVLLRSTLSMAYHLILQLILPLLITIRSWSFHSHSVTPSPLTACSFWIPPLSTSCIPRCLNLTTCFAYHQLLLGPFPIRSLQLPPLPAPVSASLPFSSLVLAQCSLSLRRWLDPLQYWAYPAYHS